MISFTSTQLDAWLVAFVFPFARILALIASSPVLGDKRIPVRVKIGLSILMCILIAPTLHDLPAVAVGSPQGLLILIQQIIIGAAMGFTMQIIFASIEMAGDLAGLQMGLGFASFYDPVNASQSSIISQWLNIVASLAFLALNGHLFIIAGLADSFQTLPIGSMITSKGFYGIASWGGNIFAYALQLSLPLLAALLITNLALGILTRAAPQLNLFAVGFPITLTIGFIVLLLMTPYFVPLLDKLTHDAIDTMLNISNHSH
ncbi:MAG: flagellar biosynthetic protein FliR [Gallionella sp.]|jgi:flagellar biosynthetic protein FliR|nr:flagellar biosynthetic protein FliR [Gallionella sp.]